MTLLHVIEWPWEEPPAPRLEELPAHEAQKLAELWGGPTAAAAAIEAGVVDEYDLVTRPVIAGGVHEVVTPKNFPH